MRQIQVGTHNAVAEGISTPVLGDLFYFFMTVGWPALFLTLAAFFLAFDLFFGFFYYVVPGCVANLNPPGFAGAFFFSVETFATVGYGDMHPQTLYGHSVAVVEIFMGLMSLALITGIMFARFSRPRARFLFTRNGVVRSIDGRKTLMFRAANQRHNVVQDATAALRMLRDDVTVEGFQIRRIIDLPLLRTHHPMFVLGWTLMHVIDEASPLESATAGSLARINAAFVLNLSGMDEDTGQMLMARAQYESTDIRWDSGFVDILHEDAEGVLHLDYGNFHTVVALGESRTERGA